MIGNDGARVISVMQNSRCCVGCLYRFQILWKGRPVKNSCEMTVGNATKTNRTKNPCFLPQQSMAKLTETQTEFTIRCFVEWNIRESLFGIEQQFLDPIGTLFGNLANRKIVAQACSCSMDILGQRFGRITRRWIVIPVNDSALCPPRVAVARNTSGKKHSDRNFVGFGGNQSCSASSHSRAHHQQSITL